MDSRGYAFTHELFCLMVAVVATSLLLVNLASLYVADSQRWEIDKLNDKARSACDNLLTYDALLHDGEHGLFDADVLDVLEADALGNAMRIEDGFIVRIDVISTNPLGEDISWIWASGAQAQDRGACVTSAAIRLTADDVRPARIVVWIWRV